MFIQDIVYPKIIKIGVIQKFRKSKWRLRGDVLLLKLTAVLSY